MKRKLMSILPRRKVYLSDVASPSPSRAARRVLTHSLHQAYNDQKAVIQKARELRQTR